MNTHRVSPSRVAGAIVTVGVLVATVLLGWRQMRVAASNPLLQDAVLAAEVASVAASVSGRIVELGVTENAAMRRGDLLFRIDPAIYRLAMEQARSDLAVAEAALRDREREVRAATANAAVAEGQLARAEENLSFATTTLDRLVPLRPKGYVSEQEVDIALTAKRNAEISLAEAERQSDAAEALAGDVDAVRALVAAREAALAIAEHELENTVVRAPHDGRIFGLVVATGEYVLPGQAIFTLIDTSSWYASAPFLKTELARISVGKCATVYAIADRRTAIRGRVDGIGWGVTSLESVNVPRGLPLVPRSLDWVCVAQRADPHLESPPERLMRVGASASATVHEDTDC
jgi:multidrug efflux system membrane fusion protein